MKRSSFFLFLISLILSCAEESNNPCENIVCLNGGGCNQNGECSCPTGYIGDDCGDTKQPTKVRVHKIQVTKFPATNSADEAWDANDGPDIYVTLGLLGGFNYLSTESDRINNAISGQQYDWDVNIIYELFPVTDDFTLDLWDYDTGPHAFMGRGTFKPYDPARGLPKEITIESSSGKVAFKLFVSYSF